MAKKKISYNPFKMMEFWVGGLVGGLLFRIFLGKGIFISLYEKCPSGCFAFGISVNAIYGILLGMLLGYLLHIFIKGMKGGDNF